MGGPPVDDVPDEPLLPFELQPLELQPDEPFELQPDDPCDEEPYDDEPQCLP